MAAHSDISLYFLQASRSIRIAWLLEELRLPYELVFYERENNQTPAPFKSDSGHFLGKAPVLKDGDLTVFESGAITEFLIETYDHEQKLLGSNDPVKRNKIRTFIHAAEGTFMIHSLAVTYARWFSPESVKCSGDLQKLEEGLYINVSRDLDWLEGEIAKSDGQFLVGGDVTAADTMMTFSIQFIFARKLCGTKGRSHWKNIERWLYACEGASAYIEAVRKTGYKL